MSMMTSIRLKDLFERQKECHENVHQLQYHHEQCQRLCQRIDRLIEPLERLEHGSSTILRDETREMLEEFLQLIDQSNEFIEKCRSNDENQFDEKTFVELQQRFDDIAKDFALALNIEQMFDRPTPVDHIEEMLQKKQHEQILEFEKLLNKRFENFHQRLIQTVSSPTSSLPFQRISRRDLSIEQELLGSGGFADVHRAIWLTHKDRVAVKILRLRHLKQIEKDFYREISMLFRIRYEHVITVLGACIEENFYAIVTEFMSLGSLYDVLHDDSSTKIHFQWSDRYSLALQMAKSINYLHNLTPMILHRDIKSMNFLLRPNGTDEMKYLLKVCDFGLAEIRREVMIQSSLNNSSQLVGSLSWKAPELFDRNGRHSPKTDVYSLGIVFWELASERRPWDEYEDSTMIIAQVRLGERPEIPSNVPEEFQQVIRESWDQNPDERPNCFQLMEKISIGMSSSFVSTSTSSDTSIPIYRIEKRRPLHRKPLWSGIRNSAPDSFK